MNRSCHSRTSHSLALILSWGIALSLAAHTPVAAQIPETVLHTFNSEGDGIVPGPLIQGSDGNFYGTTYYGFNYSNGTSSDGTVFTITSSGTLTTLHTFIGPDGVNPRVLIQGSDGKLYGTAANGGINNNGLVYQISTDGTSFKVLHTFKGTDGRYPFGLVQGSDGNLYGTTNYGGAHGAGNVYKISTSGTSFKILHTFNGTDGTQPYVGLIQGSNGILYGTTSFGGTSNDGTVYQIHTNGTNFQILHSFNDTDGYNPQPLMQGSDGNLYGTCGQGGANNDGTAFKVSPDGTTFTLLHSFDGTDGVSPWSLIQGSDGNLYGNAVSGGTNDLGTLYQISPDGTTFTLLHNFDGTNGGDPQGLIQGRDGNLYGTTYWGGANGDGTVFEISTSGSTFTLLFDFANGFYDGANPASGLTLASDGNFYGTTTNSGGTIFKISSDGTTYQPLHHFGGTINHNGTDGNGPNGLVQAADGNLYGTTTYGGTNMGCYPAYGTVFRIRTDAKVYQILHIFYGGYDGANPYAGLTMGQGSDNFLYGTAANGGANGCGTIFEIRDTTFYPLHEFNGTDGAYPDANLTLGRDGSFYGTTSRGGANNDGTVFRFLVTETGSGTLTTLHNFTGADGTAPASALIQAQDGYLYGTTSQGGTNGDGTVFKVSTDGTTFQTLHSFAGADGSNPQALIQGSNGYLYGTTLQGGTANDGTVFQISTSGKSFKLLHSFKGADGANPLGGLIEGPDGNLYGTTNQGGNQSQPHPFASGTIFQLQTQLPFIFPVIRSFSPAKVHIGKTVTLNGLNLANATSVTVNGVALTIIANTDTSLTFTVTTGTTTGRILVTTPKGTGSSATRLVID